MRKEAREEGRKGGEGREMRKDSEGGKRGKGREERNLKEATLNLKGGEGRQVRKESLQGSLKRREASGKGRK